VVCTATAEEGGTGHHLPGSGVSLTGMVPAGPGLTIGASNWLYFGDVSGSRSVGSIIPDEKVNEGISSVFSSIAGGPLPPQLQQFADLVSDRVNAGLDATKLDLKIENVTNLSSISLIYVAPWKVLGGRYAGGVVLPFLAVDTTVTIDVKGPLGKKSKRIHDSAFGFSDMVILPVILAWDAGDFHWNTGVGVYAPTGYYQAGDLAPLGKGFWSFEPFGRFTYLNSKYGQEASLGLTYMFNTINPQTDYRSGDQINIEWLVAQHLPLGFSVGATGFYYQQVTGDSGGGAKLGAFRAQSIGIGPSIGYTWKTNLAVNAQWFFEVDTTNRFQGNVISMNASWTF
jgi:hypothetical protein